MTIRTDVTVDFSVSPRIITVAAPSVTISIQDLHDTLRDIERQSYAMDDEFLVSTAGKEDLGGGVLVGLTATLNNAKLAFEARPGPAYVQCSVNGGNVVAVDDVGATFDSPIEPTAFTQVVVTASSSATLQEAQEIENIKFLVEALRPHHTGQGTVIYWNPDAGDDNFTGRSQAQGVKTFAKAHDLAGNGTHDTIMCISGTAGQTIVDETLHITKNYLFVRGPGRDFRIKPTTTTEATVRIDAVGVEISGMIVDTADTGGQNAIEVLDGADFFFLESIWSHDAQRDAVNMAGAIAYGRINGCFFSHPLENGIHLNGDSSNLRITNTEIDSPTSNGVHIEGTTARNNIIGNGTKVYNAGGWGIRIDAPGTRNFIDSDVSVYDCVLGDTLDNGTLTEDERKRTAASVWGSSVTDYSDVGTFGEAASHIGYIEYGVWLDTESLSNGNGSMRNPFNNLNDAVDFAEAQNIRRLNVTSDTTINRSLKNFVVTGVGAPLFEILGTTNDLSGTEFYHLTLRGQYVGRIVAQECLLDDGWHLDGFFENCALNGNLVCLPTSNVLLANCFSIIPGLGRPSVSMNSGSWTKLSVRSYSGGLNISDMDNAQDEVTVESPHAKVALLASCVAGTASIRGTIFFEDFSAGTAVDTHGEFGTPIRELWERVGLDKNHPVVNRPDGSFTSDNLDVDATVDGSGNITHQRI